MLRFEYAYAPNTTTTMTNITANAIAIQASFESPIVELGACVGVGVGDDTVLTVGSNTG